MTAKYDAEDSLVEHEAKCRSGMSEKTKVESAARAQVSNRKDSISGLIDLFGEKSNRTPDGNATIFGSKQIHPWRSGSRQQCRLPFSLGAVVARP